MSKENEELKPGDKVMVWGWVRYVGGETSSWIDGKVGELPTNFMLEDDGSMAVNVENIRYNVHRRQVEKVKEPREWVICFDCINDQSPPCEVITHNPERCVRVREILDEN